MAALFQSSTFEIGDRVRLQNLKSRSDLNGTISVILGHNPDGREQVTGAPNILSVSRLNLVNISSESGDMMD